MQRRTSFGAEVQHGQKAKVYRSNPNLLLELPHERLGGCLARLQMASDQVPRVGADPPVSRSASQKHSPVLYHHAARHFHSGQRRAFAAVCGKLSLMRHLSSEFLELKTLGD